MIDDQTIDSNNEWLLEKIAEAENESDETFETEYIAILVED